MTMSETQRSSERLAPVTVNLGESERRFLVERAAHESIAAGRPVSVSAVAREVLARAARQAEGGEAA
jgi:hypothetical protein